MQSDLPHTLYKKGRKKKGKKKGADENFVYNPNDKAIQLQEEANRKMRERIAAQGEKPQYTIDELFRK